jgi:5-methyltetrahydrofolate--homocysteine methyltransferase
MPYTVTASFDTAGKTMMGVAPATLAALTAEFDPKPLAFGANCGVGASDLVMSVLAITQAQPDAIVIAKANAGIPQWHGAHIHYSGTPELMVDYARLALDAGARIIGGCCGSTAVHLAAMRRAIDGHKAGARPQLADVVAALGPLVAPPSTAQSGRARRRG